MLVPTVPAPCQIAGSLKRSVDGHRKRGELCTTSQQAAAVVRIYAGVHRIARLQVCVSGVLTRVILVNARRASQVRVWPVTLFQRLSAIRQ